MYGYLTSLAFRVLDLGTGCSHTGLLLQARPTSTKRKGSGELSPSIIWWCNQTANNALFRYLLWSVHPPKKYSWSIITTPAVAKKMSFLLFQDLYCHSSSDVMCHATKCCNVIGLHYMDTACMHRSPHPSLFAEERLACETRSGHETNSHRHWITFDTLYLYLKHYKYMQTKYVSWYIEEVARSAAVKSSHLAQLCQDMASFLLTHLTFQLQVL